MHVGALCYITAVPNEGVRVPSLTKEAKVAAAGHKPLVWHGL